MFDSLSARGIVAAALIAPPDPAIFAALDRVDARQLSASVAVDLIAAWERQAAYIAFRCSAAVTHVAALSRQADQARPDYDIELSERALQCEVAAATRISENTAGSRVMVADELRRLPAVAAALRDADIPLWHATAICEAVGHLNDDQAAWVARRVLPRARHQTLAQLRAALWRAVMRIAPDRTRKNAKDARVRHDVDLYTRSDGQAELRVTGDAADVQAIYKTIQDAARKLGAVEKTSDQPRSAGQLRVAALLALVTGTNNDSGEVARPYNVTVNVTMDLPTLLGLRDNPALLDGYGALPPSLARSLAADGSWRRLLHDKTTGHLLDLGRLRYRPSPALADHVRTRDRTCIFPYCNRRAATCDLDHAVPHRSDGTGGPTSPHNLRPLCRKHHRIKHETGWTLRTSTTGPPSWVSPLGREYPVSEYDYRPPDDTDFDMPPEPEPQEPDEAPIVFKHTTPRTADEPPPF